MTIIEKELITTYLFESGKPSRVKYEIFQEQTELSSQVTIYRLEPNFGVQGYLLISLMSPADKPEQALQEVRSHFEINYA